MRAFLGSTLLDTWNPVTNSVSCLGIRTGVVTDAVRIRRYLIENSI